MSKETLNHKEVMQQHKEQFIKNNSTKSMVYENGAALGFLYREIQEIKQDVKTILNSIQNQKDHDKKES